MSTPPPTLLTVSTTAAAAVAAAANITPPTPQPGNHCTILNPPPATHTPAALVLVIFDIFINIDLPTNMMIGLLNKKQLSPPDHPPPPHTHSSQEVTVPVVVVKLSLSSLSSCHCRCHVVFWLLNELEKGGKGGWFCLNFMTSLHRYSVCGPCQKDIPSNRDKSRKG